MMQPVLSQTGKLKKIKKYQLVHRLRGRAAITSCMMECIRMIGSLGRSVRACFFMPEV